LLDCKGNPRALAGRNNRISAKAFHFIYNIPTML
jgi:hypothetical protein